MIILKPEDQREVDAAQKWLLDRGEEGCFIKASGITTNADIIAEICVMWRKHKAQKDASAELPPLTSQYLSDH